MENLKVINNVVLEVTKEDRTFTFVMPIGAKIGDAYEACWECLQKISSIASEAVEKAKKPSEE
jgi:hypothetical protein